MGKSLELVMRFFFKTISVAEYCRRRSATAASKERARRAASAIRRAHSLGL
jgi:hypothetical protein